MYDYEDEPSCPGSCGRNDHGWNSEHERSLRHYKKFDPAAYIKITEENVYIDDEVDTYINYLRDNMQGNCEFHYYDHYGTLTAAMTGQKLEPIIIGV